MKPWTNENQMLNYFIFLVSGESRTKIHVVPYLSETEEMKD